MFRPVQRLAQDLNVPLYLIENPLAEGFDILAGTASFLVPDVTPRQDYIVVRE